ncbi:MAG TPA: hypothetical protein VJ011_04005 [Steroidobacteraceae bacterium]|nr:hypothetical protein [Steroidobacteraceae bacterium]
MKTLHPRSLLAVVMLVGALLVQHPAAAGPTDALAGRKVLFVMAGDGPHRATDDTIRRYLASLGSTVAVVDLRHAAANAKGHDLVLVSSTVDGHEGAVALRDVAVPLISCESRILHDLGMTLGMEGLDFGTTETPDTYLSIVNAPHPLAAGLAAGTFVATNASVPMNWGRPGPAASVIAVPPGYPDRAAIFAYERGATLANGTPAPARRVACFFHDETFDKLEVRPEGRLAQGLPLFAAALRWAVASPASVTASPPAAANGKRALLVTIRKSMHAKAEVREAVARSNEGIQKHLESLGFAVTMAGNEDDPASMADGHDIVVIAATIRANRMLGRYKHVTIPVVNLENDILDDMSMTPKRRHVDFGEVEGRTFSIVNAAHPLAAAASETVQAFRSDTAVGFGRPGRGASIIATVPGDPDKAVYFAYEKGATMDYDFLAPARRVYFPIDFDSFDRLTDSGLSLFDAALFWAMERPR